MDPSSAVDPNPEQKAGGIAEGPTAPGSPTRPAGSLDEESALKDLTENVRDQDELERDISFQANLALIDAEDKRDQKRIEKAQLTKSRLENQKRTQQQKLRGTFGNAAARLRAQQELARIDSEIEICDKDVADFHARIDQRHQEGGAEGLGAGLGQKKLPNETQREYLIRTGKITPFATFGGPRPEGLDGDLADVIIDAEERAVADDLEEEGGYEPQSHQNLRLPGFAEEPETNAPVVESEFSLRPRKKRKVVQVEAEPASSDEFAPSPPDFDAAESPAEESDGVDLTDLTRKASRTKRPREAEGKVDLSKIDDGNESVYRSRLRDWVERRSRARRRRQERLGQTAETDTDEEWFKSSPDQPDHQFENGLKLPGDIYPSLFDYQKTGVQWLAELYAQKVGGIVGDEMGLGKTGTSTSNLWLSYLSRFDFPNYVYFLSPRG